MSIGFVGLGNMGGPLAARISARQEIFVHDLNPAYVSRAEEYGAKGCSSLSELGRKCSIVCLSLPTSAEVRSVLFESTGLAQSLSSGSLVIDFTSGSPALTRGIADELSKKMISYVDAPVSGGPQGVAAGTVAIMVGGGDDPVVRAMEILQDVSDKIYWVGPVGAGHTAKVLNNVLAAGHRLLALEVTAAATQQGLSPEKFIEVVNASSGRSNATLLTLPTFVFGDELAQGFSLGLMRKDVGLGSELISDELSELSLTRLIFDVLNRAVDELGGTSDINEVVRLYEDATHVVIAHERR